MFFRAVRLGERVWSASSSPQTIGASGHAKLARRYRHGSSPQPLAAVHRQGCSFAEILCVVCIHWLILDW